MTNSANRSKKAVPCERTRGALSGRNESSAGSSVMEYT